MTTSLLALTMALLVPANLGFAHSPPVPAQDPAAASLTQDVVALHTRYRQAGSAERVQLLSKLLSATATRHQHLAKLIEDNPGAVLRVALAADFRASLPAAVRQHIAAY